MTQQKIVNTLAQARRFVTQGCDAILVNGWRAPEQYLISPCPVSTAISIIALATSSTSFRKQIYNGLQYLDHCRNSDGGWGRTPHSASDKYATLICNLAFACAQKGVTPAAISKVGSLIGTTWMQDVPDLLLNWPPHSPLMQLIKFFLTSSPGSNLLADISYSQLPLVLAYLPPAGRPLLLALAGIHGHAEFRNQRAFQNEIKKIPTFQSANGGWCEDMVTTALCVLCLYLTGLNPSAQYRGLQWLVATQYASGAWPSFNQLINWDIGLFSHLLAQDSQYIHPLLRRCGQFLTMSVYTDGSFGITSPYAFPDTDDTAIALSGLAVYARIEPQHFALVTKTAEKLVQLQNPDGSWGTFPEVDGFPPNCHSRHPVHITSVDVSVHVLQALIQANLPVDTPTIQKGLRWLAQQQSPSGSWKTIWFLGKVFATSQALELFVQLGVYPQHQKRAVNWLRDKQLPTGAWPNHTAGECALAISALLLSGEVPNSPSIQMGLYYLQSIQQANGSFKPGYAGVYAGGLYYEDPIAEALAVIQAITRYGRTLHQHT